LVTGRSEEVLRAQEFRREKEKKEKRNNMHMCSGPSGTAEDGYRWHVILEIVANTDAATTWLRIFVSLSVRVRPEPLVFLVISWL
jgi:hypothetical protein